MKPPQVTLKLATSLDGRIALGNGASRWLTGREARRVGHGLRADHDAVLIGSGTALADDPLLTVRHADTARQPARMVLDSRLRAPPQSRLCRSARDSRAILVCRDDTPPARAEPLEALGVEIWRCPGDAGGGVALGAFLDRAASEGMATILLEGGGRLASAFLRRHPPERIEWFRAPRLIGADGAAAIGPLGLEKLETTPRYRRVAWRELGDDVLESLVAVG